MKGLSFPTGLYAVLAIIASTAGAARGYRTVYRGVDLREGASCPPENGQFSHPKYCDKFLNCWDGELVVGHCANGLVFNPKTSACDYPRNVDCSGREDSRPAPPSSAECPKPFGTFASSSNCSQFIVCHAGNATTHTCPNGLFYNQDLGVCTYERDTYCVGVDEGGVDQVTGPPTSVPMQTSTMSSSPTSVPIISPQNPTSPQAPQSPPETPEPPTSTSAPFPVEVPNDPDQILWPAWPNWPTMKCPIVQGFLPVLGDCEAVVVCLGGLGHFFRCPTGHAFDLTTGKCGPIRVTEGCRHHQFPEEDQTNNNLVRQLGGGKVKYVYLPLNMALLHQRGNNLNY